MRFLFGSSQEGSLSVSPSFSTGSSMVKRGGSVKIQTKRVPAHESKVNGMETAAMDHRRDVQGSARAKTSSSKRSPDCSTGVPAESNLAPSRSEMVQGY